MTTRRRFLALAGTTALTGVAGCGYRPGGGDVRWRNPGGSAVAEATEAGVAGSSLYAVDRSVSYFDFEADTFYQGGRVTAYRTDDGTRSWRIPFETALTAYSIDAGGVAVGVEDQVVRLDADGEMWRTRSDWTPRAVALGGERVYAVTDESTLVAVADGSVRWTARLVTREAGADPPRSRPLVAATDEFVTCSTVAGTTAFHDDGTRRWSRTDLTPTGLRVAPELVLAETAAGLVALDPGSGETRWTVGVGDGDGRPVVASDTPVVASDAVYVRADGSVVALDRRNGGGRRWTHPTGSPETDRSLAAGERGVYVATDAGLTALDGSGTERWSVDYDRLSAGPFLADSGVLVAGDGAVVCHVP